MCYDLYSKVLGYLTIDDRLKLGVEPSPLNKQSGVVATVQQIHHTAFCMSNVCFNRWSLELKLNDKERKSVRVIGFIKELNNSD